MSVSRDLPQGATRPASGPDVVALESGLWSAFARARTEGAFLTGWLALLLHRVPGAGMAALLEVDHGTGVVGVRAAVPDPRADISAARPLAERVLSAGRPATETMSRPEGSDAPGATLLAYPLRPEDEAPVAAVVVMALTGEGAEAAARPALREVHWAAGWLAARLWQARARDEAAARARAATALDMVALLAEHQRLEPAAMALVNALAPVMGADRVSLGMIAGARSAPRIRLVALSHAAWFRRRSGLAEGLETAMEECFDQAAGVALPALPDTARAIAIAHAEYLKGSGGAALLSVPLPDEAGVVGALTLERRDEGRPFTADDLMMAEAIAALTGPVLELKRRNRRWLGGRIVDGTVFVLGVVLGPRRLGWKLLAASLVALAVAAATVTAPFRLQAEAVLRGETQRAAVAPFAGYIDTAPLRAGDRVAAGDLLAALDATDLRLEELRWRSEIDRLEAQARDALARYDRTQLGLIEAQIEQARAQLRLTEARLARTRVLAPIDGVIVAGDLSQRLGAPVQAGEVLFEVAPLDAFRIDIHLDERDLPHVAPGQTGRLMLTGDPGDGRALVVERITPLAAPREGINTFRIEARLTPEAGADAPLDRLRPGMEGIAKIEVERRLVSWIWTRRLTDWLRRTFWAWTP